MGKKQKTIDLGTGKVTEETAPGSQLTILPTVKHSSVKETSMAAFAALTTEVFFGMQIIKLKVGEAAGPFILLKILEKQDCTPAGAKKKFDPVDVYIGKDEQGLEIRMPISASFIGKAVDSKLSPGDEFHIMRQPDYTSKNYSKENCQSYALAITKRAKKS